MTQQILELLVQGKDEASSVMKGIGGAVSGLGSITSAVATGGLALVGAAIAAVAAGAVAAGVAVMNFSMDSNDAMKMFSAQTGITGEDLDEFKGIAQDVWKEGFGDSITDVIDQMAIVKLAFGETGEELEASTKRAMTLAEVFDIDINESTATVSSMMKSYGITSQEAFDIITAGSQAGLNVMGDLTDTLHEYSADFDNLGFTAEQTLSILNAGLEAGAYNTDVVADGFREMGIRLMEGGDDMTATFETLGLDFETMQAGVAAGDAVWGDYTSAIVTSLMEMDDEVARNAAGVEIFGTKWEDLGGDVFMAAGLATEGIGNISGATDAAQAALDTGIGPALERLKRGFIENLSPLGDIAAEMLDKLAPHLDTASVWLSEKIPLAVEYLKTKWDEYWPIIKDTALGVWESLQPAFITIQELLGNVGKGASVLGEIWSGVFTVAKTILLGFWSAIKPAIVWVWDNLTSYYNTLIPMLVTAWEDLKAGFQPIIDLWNNSLMPAFQALKEALGLVKGATDETTGSTGLFGEGIGQLVGTFASTAVQVLIDGITAGVQLLTIAFTLGKTAVEGIKNMFERARPAFDAIGTAISGVVTWIGNLIDRISNIRLPDWLTPGSPTPFEMGLRGITKELKSMPSFDEVFGAPQFIPAFAGPTRGGPLGPPPMSSLMPAPPVGYLGGSRSGEPRGSRGGTYEININFGRDSVRSVEDIMEAADRISHTLEVHGLQPVY